MGVGGCRGVGVAQEDPSEPTPQPVCGGKVSVGGTNVPEKRGSLNPVLLTIWACFTSDNQLGFLNDLQGQHGYLYKVTWL